MKIKTKERSYESVMRMQKFAHIPPKKQRFFFRLLMRTFGKAELKAVGFTYNEIGMEKLGKKEPCLYLMNHSSFLDLKIASNIIYPKPFHTVCTIDGFVGMDLLMRMLGCIPTKKFTTDATLIKDMIHVLKKYKESVLMFPEASYSFDGTATPLPFGLGKCIKMLKVPVIMITNKGGFLHDPLYNGLKLRKVKVSADMKYLLSPEDIEKKSVEEINEILRNEFTFDHFKWQQDNGVVVAEPFRADHLNRVLFKCPHCLKEGTTEGKGTRLICKSCGKGYELTEEGFMRAETGETEIEHIPDWYKWERENVRKEIEAGTYKLDIAVDIMMMVNTKCMYKVGEGRLVHTVEGFHLTGCDGKLDYYQKPRASYSLYADYFWYEIGDMICIGDHEAQYYCFPKEAKDIVAKTRLATEEIYKLVSGETA